MQFINVYMDIKKHELNPQSISFQFCGIHPNQQSHRCDIGLHPCDYVRVPQSKNGYTLLMRLVGTSVLYWITIAKRWDHSSNTNVTSELTTLISHNEAKSAILSQCGKLVNHFVFVWNYMKFPFNIYMEKPPWKLPSLFLALSPHHKDDSVFMSELKI